MELATLGRMDGYGLTWLYQQPLYRNAEFPPQLLELSFI